MVLIDCPECGRSVSSLAPACPDCACPQSAFPKLDAPKVEVAPEKPAPARVIREAEAPSSSCAEPDLAKTRFSDLPLTDRGERPALVDAFIRGFDFESRTSRSDYWRAFFTALILALVLGVIDVASGLVFTDRRGDPEAGVLSSLFSLLWLIPWFALNTRRLHDVGVSGWNFLWCLTGIGVFYVIYLQTLPSGGGVGHFEKFLGGFPDYDSAAREEVDDESLDNEDSDFSVMGALFFLFLTCIGVAVFAVMVA